MIKIIDLPCINLETYKGMEKKLNKELAEIIIDKRREKGGFNTIGELMEIDDIDADTLAIISRLYTVKTTAAHYEYFDIKLEGEDLHKAKRIDHIINYKEGNSVKNKSNNSEKHKYSGEIIFTPMARKYFREGSIIEFCEGDPFEEPFELNWNNN